MATVLEMYSIEEQRFVVRFLCAKGLNANDIHKEIFSVYGGKRLWRKAVHNWNEKFSQGHSNVADDARPVYAISLGGYACRVLGFSGRTFSQFSKAWLKCEF
jgi:hypothetical protein